MGKKVVLGIIQARMGSSRLPGKTLMKIQGKPMLEHVIDRLKKCKTIDRIVVATTKGKDDKKIINLLKKLNIEYYAGSSKNVLKRFYDSSLKFKGDIIVRITADDPFKDPKIIDSIVKFYINHD